MYSESFYSLLFLTMQWRLIKIIILLCQQIPLSVRVPHIVDVGHLEVRCLIILWFIKVN